MVATHFCTQCKERKPISEFYRGDVAKSWSSWCKECFITKERDRRYRYDYGITLAEYQEMHEAQAGVCDICGNPETRLWRGKVVSLSVDHCHKTGTVRGLLCRSCNTALGGFKDDPYLLRAAANYLEK